MTARGCFQTGWIGLLVFGLARTAPAQNPPATVAVDASAPRRAIDPRIYGVAFASEADLLALNAPLHRSGGNATSQYNWQLNASNRGEDWFFESIGSPSAVAGADIDAFVQASRGAGAQPMVTVPMIGWVARLGPNRGKLASFSIAKYGPQTANDWQWFPDAGNGVLTNGQLVPNDPHDANQPADVEFQRAWVRHLVGRWGGAAGSGLRYYVLDNEHSIWHGVHRDVHPVGARMEEVRDKMIAYATMIKAEDPAALVVGPEEWGWSGYLLSGYDQQWGARNGWSNLPDRTAHGNADYLPWLLGQLRQREAAGGPRLLDVFTVHFYPQGGEFSNDTTQAMQLRRNRSTRALWDPAYVDETWIGDRVRLIPRLKEWAATHYRAGTPVGLTEYNWGAEEHVNGATTQADILGIFGREGLDVAARWTTPAATTPTFKAIQMYRNYDGVRSTFGDLSVLASGADPDVLASFAAVRSSDGALTVMLVHKALTGSTAATVSLAGFQAQGTAQVWRLGASNVIQRLTDVAVSGNAVATTLPAQSVTLLVIAPANATPTATPAPTPTPTPTPTTTPTPRPFPPTQGRPLGVPLPLFPADNWWNQDVSAAPVDPQSATFISFIGATRGMHPDFGGIADPAAQTSYGIPYVVVGGAQPKKAVQFEYWDESDGVDANGNGVPFYPIPDEAITQPYWIEGGPPGNVDVAGDRHMLIVDRDRNHLYELFDLFHDGTRWRAGSGAFFDMNTNNRRPEGWTSADAAGLAILPGLVRYDEVFGSEAIRHAFRVTVRATSGHVYPASHTACGVCPADALPMGARLRLKATKDISGYTPEVRRILQAMKTYGLIVADNGSDLYVTGTFDTRWNNSVLNPAFASIRASDFEVIQRGWRPASSPTPTPTAGPSPTPTATPRPTLTPTPGGSPTPAAVMWTNLVQASASAGTLTKTGGSFAYDSGAISTQSIASGGGYVEFTTPGLGHRTAGFGVGDSNQHYGDIDFAIFTRADGSFNVMEKGSVLSAGGTYAAGDLFRIEIVAGVARYYRNAALVHTSAQAVAYPLVVDTALYTPGVQVGNARIGIASAVTPTPNTPTPTPTARPTAAPTPTPTARPRPTATPTPGGSPTPVTVAWTNLVSASASGGTLTKTGGNLAYDSGAISTQSIASGDTYVELTMPGLGYRAAGFGVGDSNQHYGDIDFAIFTRTDGSFNVMEKGSVLSAGGTYAAGDLFRIEIVAGVARYSRNGALVHTSTQAAAYPLVVDTALYTPGVEIGNARIGIPVAPAPTATPTTAPTMAPTPTTPVVPTPTATPRPTSTPTPPASATPVAVTWTNLVLASASGGTLTKTGGNFAYDAGAISTQSIASGDGYVELTTPGLGHRTMGLGVGDTSQHYSDVDFAIFTRADGSFNVMEKGTVLSAGGTYAGGDLFRIEIVASVVRYHRNGALVHTSTQAVAYPLVVDTALYTPGVQVGNARIGVPSAAAPTPTPTSAPVTVAWVNLVQASASTGTLTKTGGVDAYDSGASSSQSIPAGDGSVEFTVPALGYRTAGLGVGDSNQHYGDVDFAIFTRSDGTYNVMEKGSVRSAGGSYAPGDVFRIEIEGGLVRYRRNGTLIYTSTQAIAYPLVLDTALYTAGVQVGNAKISGAP